MHVNITITMSLISHVVGTVGCYHQRGGGQTGEVVSVADYGQSGLWFETWPGRRSWWP